MHILMAKGGRFEFKMADVPYRQPAKEKTKRGKNSPLRQELDNSTQDARRKEGIESLPDVPLQMTLPQLETLLFEGGSHNLYDQPTLPLANPCL